MLDDYNIVGLDIKVKDFMFGAKGLVGKADIDFVHKKHLGKHAFQSVFLCKVYTSFYDVYLLSLISLKPLSIISLKSHSVNISIVKNCIKSPFSDYNYNI